MISKKCLFSYWKTIEKALRGKFVYLFLDYDGTLAPIVETPGKAVMPKKTKDLLRKLSKIPDCKIAIVSGRALNDISRRVGVKNIVYVGNHGFEIKGPKTNYTSPVPLTYRRTLEEIKAKLEKKLSSIKGVLIEDKGFSLGVHYRSADKRDVVTVKNEFYATLFLYDLKKNVQVRPGKMLLEVRPPVPWNKGEVVLWLLRRQLFAAKNNKMKVMPVYIGDDATDEDAFGSLADKGITIFVGRPSKTKARFCLKDTEEVTEFLEAVLERLNTGATWRTKK